MRPRVLVIAGASAVFSLGLPAASAVADETAAGSAQPVVVTAALHGETADYRATAILDVVLDAGSAVIPAGTLTAMVPVGGSSHAILDAGEVHVDAGTASIALPFRVVASGTLSVTVSFLPDDSTDLVPVESAPVGVPVVAQASAADVTAPATLRRTLDSGPVVATLKGAVDGLPINDVSVVLQQRSTDTKNAWVTLASGVTDAAGTLRATTTPWYSTAFRLVYAGTPDSFTPVTSAAVTTTTVAPGKVVVFPKGVPQPGGHPLPPLGRADAPTAHAVITPIPDAVWKSMVGVSWAPGCPVGRAELAYIRVNYYGFDGNRYRGELVVSRRYAAAVVAVFTGLHDMRFPLRSVRRPDVFGRSPNGWPGANDYASMAHDNSYAFNCRYVVGKERSRVLSPHALGYAIDINTWENPDRTSTGTFPDAWFASHRTPYGGVVTSAVVALFARHGFGWGRAFGDLQHFDPTIRH